MLNNPLHCQSQKEEKKKKKSLDLQQTGNLGNLWREVASWHCFVCKGAEPKRLGQTVLNHVAMWVKGADEKSNTHKGKKNTSWVNSPVPFPTACIVASGPRVSKSSFISSAQKHRRRKRRGEGGREGERRGWVPQCNTQTNKRWQWGL